MHNLFAGRMVQQAELTRWTPYYFPHETSIAGYSNITGGDDRFYNNIFLRDDDADDKPRQMSFFAHLLLEPRGDEKEESQGMDGVPDAAVCYLHPTGLGAYGLYPDTMEKHEGEFSEEEKKERTERYGRLYPLGRWALPVQLQGNVYFGGAVPCKHEKDAVVFQEKGMEVRILSEGRISIRILNPELRQKILVTSVSGKMLGKTHHAEMAFENPDGTEISLDQDFFGNQRDCQSVMPGPFEQLWSEIQEYIIE